MGTKPTYEELLQQIDYLNKKVASQHAAFKQLGLEPSFVTFTEKSPNMIFINQNGRVVYANKKCEEVMGYTRKELYSSDFDFRTLIAPESQELVWTNFRRHMKGEELEPYEYALISKDGQKIEAIITSRLITYEGESAILGIVTDITARKEAEEALRKSEAIFRLTFQNAPIGIALCKMDGSFVQANPAYCNMMGYTESELQKLKFQDITDPDDLVTQMPYYEKCLQGEIESYQIDKRYITKDKETIWVNMTAAVTQDESGNPLYALIMAKDITEVKRAEENRYQLEIQLRQAQKMEAIGTLAGGIAHDFNNILGIIIGFTEIAYKDAAEGSILQHNMQRILDAGHRAKDLVKQILAFSHKSGQDKRIILLAPIIKESLKLLRASLPATIRIRQKIEPNLGAISADPIQIHQVMMNLCTNSAHAMEKTGGILEVQLKNTKLIEADAAQFPDLAPGSCVKLIVRDTGCGMDSATLERIFEPYFTTKQKGEGTGLGLAVVHGIVRQQGGSINVSSAQGKGSTFEIFWPAAVSEVRAEAAQMNSPPTGNENILFVDDEKSLIELGDKMLSSLGYHVVTKTDPLAAIEIFKANPDQFDLVITDMAMPNMSGTGVAKKLMKIRADIPIVLCTGFSKLVDAETAKSFGIKGFLMKPITIHRLAETVREVLQMP
jgi:PAS domain S-box-containing protein